MDHRPDHPRAPSLITRRTTLRTTAVGGITLRAPRIRRAAPVEVNFTGAVHHLGRINLSAGPQVR